MADYDQHWMDEMFSIHAVEFDALVSRRPISSVQEDFFAGVIEEFGCPDLGTMELGCGNGRWARALAACSRFYLGIDKSKELLDRASRIDAPNIMFIEADFRDMGTRLFPRRIGNVTRCYTSLGYFDRDVERDIFSRCREIAPGGCLLVDSFNGDWLREIGSFSRSHAIGSVGFLFTEQYAVSELDRRLHAVWTYSPRETTRQDVKIEFELDCYSPQDAIDLLDSAGWTVVAQFHDFSKDARVDTLESHHERMILVCR
jgi:SAM-dependent methyltransferase